MLKNDIRLGFCKMKCAVVKNGPLSANRLDSCVSSGMMDEHPGSFYLVKFAALLTV